MTFDGVSPAFFDTESFDSFFNYYGKRKRLLSPELDIRHLCEKDIFLNEPFVDTLTGGKQCGLGNKKWQTETSKSLDDISPTWFDMETFDSFFSYAGTPSSALVGDYPHFGHRDDFFNQQVRDNMSGTPVDCVKRKRRAATSTAIDHNTVSIDRDNSMPIVLETKISESDSLGFPSGAGELGMRKALANIYHYVAGPKATRCSPTCYGHTDAQIRRKGVEDIIEMLVTYAGLCVDSIVFHAGISLGQEMGHISQVVPCRYVGMEVEPLRIWLCAKNYLKAIDDKENVGSLVNTRVAIVLCDMFRLPHLCETTHYYSFDEAFEPALMNHLMKICQITATIKYVVSYKASKYKRYHTLWKDHGFDVIAKACVKKCGSGESNTAYLYARRCEPEGAYKKAALPENGVDMGKLMAEYVHPVWSHSKLRETLERVEVEAHSRAFCRN
jgi:hypothetical protein